MRLEPLRPAIGSPRRPRNPPARKSSRTGGSGDAASGGDSNTGLPLCQVRSRGPSGRRIWMVPVDPGNRPAASSLGSDLPALRAGKRSHLRRGVREACRSSEGRAAAGTLRAGARRALAAAQLIASPAQVAAIPAWVAAGGVGRLAPRRRGLPPRRGGLRSRRGWLRLSRPGPRRLPLKRFLQPAIFR